MLLIRVYFTNQYAPVELVLEHEIFQKPMLLILKNGRKKEIMYKI